MPRRGDALPTRARLAINGPILSNIEAQQIAHPGYCESIACSVVAVELRNLEQACIAADLQELDHAW